MKVLARVKLSEKPSAIKGKNGEKIMPTGDSVLLKTDEYVFWEDEYENEIFDDDEETIKLSERKRILPNGLPVYDWYDEKGVAIRYGINNNKCVVVPVNVDVA